MSIETFLCPATFNQEARSVTQIQRPGLKPNEYFGIEFSGQFYPQLFNESLNCVVDRHEALRTDFPLQKTDNRRMQRIWKSLTVENKFIDLSDHSYTENIETVKKRCMEWVSLPFKIDQAPLLYSATFKLSSVDWIFVIICDHLIIDGLSINILWSELLSIYKSKVTDSKASLPVVERQFRDFAIWQRDRLMGVRLRQLEKYWRLKLSNPPETIKWNHLLRREGKFTYRSEVLRIEIEPNVFSGLKVIANAKKSNMFSIFNTFLIEFVKMLGSCNEILIHTPFANRANAVFNRTIGYFANGVILRIPVHCDCTFAYKVESSFLAVKEALAYSEYPLALVREYVGPRVDDSYGHRAQVSHLHYNFFRVPNISIPGLSSNPKQIVFDDAFSIWAYDIGFCSYILNDRAEIAIWYNSKLFDKSLIANSASLLTDYIELVSSGIE